MKGVDVIMRTLRIPTRMLCCLPILGRLCAAEVHGLETQRAVSTENRTSRAGRIVEHVLFRQPSLPGIEGRLHVQARVPAGEFAMIGWQRNPATADGTFVPIDWDVGTKTGVSMDGDRLGAQRGMRESAGSTAVQMAGGGVGAYLNSADLSVDGLDTEGRPLPGSDGYKLMVTPQVQFAPGEAVHPFRSDHGEIRVSLELQVPVAECAGRKGSLAYVNPVLVFIDAKRKVKISYIAGVFSKRTTGDPSKDVHHIAHDAPSRSWMIQCRLLPGNRWMTVSDESETFQTSPWRGWRRFAFAITRENFAAALRALREQQPETDCSVDPADYGLRSFHLNAEINYETAPAELGWSMRRAEIVITAAQSSRITMP